MNIDKRLAKSVTKSLIHSLFVDGTLTKDDLKDKSTLWGKVSKLLKKNVTFNFVIDHTETLLSTAQEYSKKGKYEYAKMFYALFFEHSTNGLINSECTKRKISRESINEILRLNLEQKLTWLLEFLKLPKYKSDNLIKIKKLSDERNAFVHYKYKSEPGDVIPDIDKEKEENKNQIEDIKKCVEYHKTYITKALYSGNKKKLSKLLI